MNCKINEKDYYQSGMEYQRLQQWGNAINAYKKALEQHPNDVRAMTALEYIYDILAFKYNDLFNP